METIWFALVALMLAGYVVLDGFDLGAGVLHLAAARTDAERRTVLQSIGPVWDGNEVWLVAAGGTLFYAFPLLYASSFSGFYLALNIVLWLLIFRALGIELRMHLSNPVWVAFFDGAFSLASILLIVFFGAALGNVLRGVPLGADHYFFVPLWTDFRPGPSPGILDWYTVLCAVVTLAAVSVHGALYLIVKTTGPINARLRRLVRTLWPILLVLFHCRFSRYLEREPAPAGSLSRAAGRLADPYARHLRAGRHPLFHARRTGASRVPFVLPLPLRHTRRSRFRTLSRAPALIRRSGQQPDHRQCRRRGLVALRRPGLVGYRDADRHRLFRDRLYHVPRQNPHRGP